MASDYQGILQDAGPWGGLNTSAQAATNALLLMGDGSATGTDTMRTAAMVAQGWGDAATAHTAAKNGTVAIGETGFSMLTGADDVCFDFTGAGELLPADAGGDFNFTVGTPWTINFRIRHAYTPTGVREFGLVTRSTDFSSLYRGIRIVLRDNGSDILPVVYLIDTLGVLQLSKGDTVPLVAGTKYTIGVTYDGSNTLAGIKIYTNGSSAANAVGSATGVVTTITGGTLRIGSDAESQNRFTGQIAGLGILRRCLPPECMAQLHDAATTAATERTYSKNLGIFKQDLGTNMLLRAAGDSTANSLGNSLGDSLPRRLQTDGRIPRRAAHYKSLAASYAITNATAINTVTNTDINTTPAAPWATPVAAKPATNFSVITHKAYDTPITDAEVTFGDLVGDLMDTATWPACTARFLFAKANNASASPAVGFKITDGTLTAYTGDVVENGADTKHVIADASIPATSGTIVCTTVGTASNESSKQNGVYGVLLVRGATFAGAVTGLHYYGASGEDAATTDSFDDDTLFAMSAITLLDAALVNGEINFSAKWVRFNITINDVNTGRSAATVQAALAAIAARWNAIGYKVLFTQPHLVYLLGATSASSRLPTADYDDLWTNAFLPVAVGNVAVDSAFQRRRGVPFQFVENHQLSNVDPLNNYAIHAVDPNGALRLNIPTSLNIGDASVPSTSTGRLLMLLLQGQSEED